jgi:hypothetical protein
MEEESKVIYETQMGWPEGRRRGGGVITDVSE